MSAPETMIGAKGREVLVTTITLTVLAALFVGLRIYTRFFMMQNSGREDWMIIIAMAFSISLTALIGEQVKYGMGEHIYSLAPEMLVRSLKPFWGSIPVYYLSLTFTKISILFQYLRVFPAKNFQIATWVMMAVVIAYGIATFFNSVFLCWPVAFFWDKTIVGGTCVNQFVVWFANAGINITTDFLIVLLPMPILRGLNMPKRQKQLLIAVFALGGFVCVVSILRLQSLVRISNSSDPTYDNPPAATWSCVETNVGIICACLPSLRPLVSRMFPRFLSTLGSGQDPKSETRLKSMGATRASKFSHLPSNTSGKFGSDSKKTSTFVGTNTSSERVLHNPNDKDISVVTVIEQTYELAEPQSAVSQASSNTLRNSDKASASSDSISIEREMVNFKI